MKKFLLVISCIILAIGVPGGPLTMRLYFLHGGRRVWLTSFLETAGFPIMLLPLAISYIHRRTNPTTSQSIKTKMVYMEPPLFFTIALLGILTGLSTFLYAFGMARLPVTTCSLIMALQLACNALFSFLLVRQKFTAYSVNAVVLLTLGAGVLALHASGDRPVGVSTKQYVMGFVTTVACAVLDGLLLPLVELGYKKTKQAMTYSLVLEVQLVMCMFATVFTLIGMIVNNDFKVIPREARNFGLGEANYYLLLVGCAIIWQAFFLGIIGVIFCASSLLSGILIAMFLPVTEVLAVIFYKENFKAEKGVALILSLWGFVSYFYGEFKQSKEIKNHTPETEPPQALTNPTP